MYVLKKFYGKSLVICYHYIAQQKLRLVGASGEKERTEDLWVSINYAVEVNNKLEMRK